MDLGKKAFSGIGNAVKGWGKGVGDAFTKADSGGILGKIKGSGAALWNAVSSPFTSSFGAANGALTTLGDKGKLGKAGEVVGRTGLYSGAALGATEAAGWGVDKVTSGGAEMISPHEAEGGAPSGSSSAGAEHAGAEGDTGSPDAPASPAAEPGGAPLNLDNPEESVAAAENLHADDRMAVSGAGFAGTSASENSFNEDSIWVKGMRASENFNERMDGRHDEQIDAVTEAEARRNDSGFEFDPSRVERAHGGQEPRPIEPEPGSDMQRARDHAREAEVQR